MTAEDRRLEEARNETIRVIGMWKAERLEKLQAQLELENTRLIVLSLLQLLK